MISYQQTLRLSERPRHASPPCRQISFPANTDLPLPCGSPPTSSLPATTRHHGQRTLWRAGMGHRFPWWRQVATPTSGAANKSVRNANGGKPMPQVSPLTREFFLGTSKKIQCCPDKSLHEAPPPFTGGGWGVGEEAKCRAAASFPPNPNPPPQRGEGTIWCPNRQCNFLTGQH